MSICCYNKDKLDISNLSLCYTNAIFYNFALIICFLAVKYFYVLRSV